MVIVANNCLVPILERVYDNYVPYKDGLVSVLHLHVCETLMLPNCGAQVLN